MEGRQLLMTSPAGPVTPKPMGSVGRLQLSIVAATVWNGLLVALAWPLLTNRSAEDWFQAAILGVFAFIGLLLAIRLPHCLLALLSPRPHLTLSAEGALPGGTIQVSWRFSGAVARLRKVVFSLEGTASTSWRRRSWGLEETVGTHSSLALDATAIGSLRSGRDPSRATPPHLPLFAASIPESGTSMRIMPSCRDVIKSSPSPLMLMCMSARDAVAPFAASTSSRNDT